MSDALDGLELTSETAPAEGLTWDELLAAKAWLETPLPYLPSLGTSKDNPIRVHPSAVSAWQEAYPELFFAGTFELRNGA